MINSSLFHNLLFYNTLFGVVLCGSSFTAQTSHLTSSGAERGIRQHREGLHKKITKAQVLNKPGYSRKQSSCEVREAWGQSEEEGIGTSLRGYLTACGLRVVNADRAVVECPSFTDPNLKEERGELTKDFRILQGKLAATEQSPDTSNDKTSNY